MFQTQLEIPVAARTAKPKPEAETVKVRIIVAVDCYGKAYASTAYNSGFYAPDDDDDEGNTNDQRLIEGAVDSSDDEDASKLTLRFIDVVLPKPVVSVPKPKVLTLSDI